MNQQTQAATKVLFVFFLIVMFFLGGFLLGRIDLQGQQNPGLSSEANNYQVTGDLKSEYNNVDVDLLWEIWDIVETEYIEQGVDGQELLYGAARGLVSGLDDRYTAFLSPDETSQ